MRRLQCALLATVAAIGFASIASAADMPVKAVRAPAPIVAPPAWYISIYGGWAKMNDYNFDFVSAAGTHFPYTTSFDNGWVAGGAFGREFFPWLRLEVDVSTGRNKASSYHSNPPTFVGTGVSGSTRMTTVTGNAWLSYPVGPLSVYAGGGAGVGFVRADLTTTNGAGAQYSGSDNGLALVAGVGLRYAFTSNIEGDLGYRYRTTRHVTIPSSIAGFTTTSGNVSTNAIQGGLTFKF